MNIAVILLVCVFQIGFAKAIDDNNYNFARTNNNDLQKCLSSSLSSSVYTIYPCNTLENQNSSQYKCDHFDVNSLLGIRGGRIPHLPAVIVYVMNSNDVQNVVKCATKLNYIVNALSGGHSYEGHGLGSKHNNIIINIEGINYININQSDRTGKFGAGTRLDPIHYTAYQYDNLTINGGTCAWVGLAGLALGGGKGELLAINESHEPDLYWALRGGGGGLFVIVTEFKLRLVQAPLLVMMLTSVWDANATKLVIQRYQSLIFNEKILNLPNNIFILLTVKSATVDILLSYYGVELEEFNRIVSLFLSTLPSPLKINITELDWLSFVYEHSSLSNPSDDIRELLLNNLTYPTYYFKAKHLFYDQPVSDDSLDQLISRLTSTDSSITLQFELWGGYLNTIPVDQTAFLHRHYKFDIQFMVCWDNDQDENEQLNRLNQVYLTVYNDSTKYSYINYIDRDLPNWMNAYYNTHQQRLIHIKHIYDKDNRFDFERTIQLSGANQYTFFNFHLSIFVLFLFFII
ncbi:unnamed protein product [Adineta steineri]|uniref:FAD-binding PCMH-type domain-containing protein n=1 Tax=Adineta steineri TaxID=433720 RepID=A0A815DFV0_9BILA|nr:unnamed protein product [Adineta steineri]CAF1098080.1 unnamed protein product [Adineta steineri]CAF1295771.1 unnamed protein product [Adineta steineri]